MEGSEVFLGLDLAPVFVRPLRDSFRPARNREATMFNQIPQLDLTTDRDDYGIK